MERPRGDHRSDHRSDRFRDHRADRFRDRDHHRGGGGGGGDDGADDRDSYNHHNNNPRRPSRFSDGPPVDSRRSPGDFRGDFSSGGPHRAFESPPRQPHHHPSGGGGGFPPFGANPGPGGFPPPHMVGEFGGGGGGGPGFGPDGFGIGNEFQPPPSIPPPAQQLSGQKRGFPFSNRQEHSEGRRFVKLFVGSVPRTASEDEIRPLFEKHGKVLEVAFIKDKRTGQPQGCCFIKYGTSEEADRAIRGLHNQYTLTGGVGPIQVRYADGGRERFSNGAVEYKLFVGSINKCSTEKELEQIFSPYGHIEDVYLIRDESKKSRGCGFVKYSSKDSAIAAISALHGIYLMPGCDQPLIVRFADPKRPRAGEQRTGPGFGSPDFGPLPPPGIRPPPGPNFDGSMGSMGPSNAWRPMSPQNFSQSNAVAHGFSNPFPSKLNDASNPLTPGGHLGPQGSITEGSVSGAVPVSSTSPQYYNQSFPQGSPSKQQISPLQKPLSSPQNFPAQAHHGPGPYSQTQTSQPSLRWPHQLQTGGQVSYNQAFPSQQASGFMGQMPPAQFQVQQGATSSMAQHPQQSISQQPNTSSGLLNAQQPALAPQQPVPFQHSPSPMAQMLSQQTQTLQATYQTSQQAISQLQQQVQMMQPSNHNQPPQQNYQAAKQQSQWAGAMATSAVAAASSDVPSTSSVPTLPAAPVPAKCNWTEHTSPDGYKYYYNNVTNESRWIKPEEFTSYEQQKLSTQQPQNHPSLQAVPSQQASQTQTPQLQAQFHQTEQLQHPSLSSAYQVPKSTSNQTAQEAAYTQRQAPAYSLSDPSRFQQGFQANQGWGWRGNSGGT